MSHNTKPARNSPSPATIVDYSPTPPAVYKPFPTHLLPAASAAIIRAGAASIDCDPAFLALPALAAMGGTIGNRRHAMVKAEWTEPPNVWAMLISPSSTAKTPAAKLVMKPVRERNAKLIAANADAVKAYAAELQRYEAAAAKWKAKQDGDPPERPALPPAERAIVDDATIEALAAVLNDNPAGVLLVRDELAGWFGSFDRYAKSGGSDQSRWESIFNGDPFTIDRRTSGTLDVPQPAVSLYGGTQPARLPKLLTNEVRGGGLLGRLLIAAPPPRPKRFNVKGPDAAAVDSWRRLLNYLATLDMAAGDNGRPVPVLIPMTTNAQAAFGRWADAHNAATLTAGDDLAAARGKLEAYAVRFALIFAVCEPSATINAEHVQHGCELADWFAAEAERVYEGMAYAAADAEAAEVETWILRKGGRVTQRELSASGPRKFRGNANAATVAAVLARIEVAGRGRWEYDPRRPGQRGPDARWFTLAGCGNGNEFAAADVANAEPVSVSTDSMPAAADPAA